MTFEVTIFLKSNKSKMVQYTAILTMADKVYDLSSGAIFNDLDDR